MNKRGTSPKKLEIFHRLLFLTCIEFYIYQHFPNYVTEICQETKIWGKVGFCVLTDPYPSQNFLPQKFVSEVGMFRHGPPDPKWPVLTCIASRLMTCCRVSFRNAPLRSPSLPTPGKGGGGSHQPEPRLALVAGLWTGAGAAGPAGAGAAGPAGAGAEGPGAQTGPGR